LSRLSLALKYIRGVNVKKHLLLYEPSNYGDEGNIIFIFKQYHQAA